MATNDRFNSHEIIPPEEKKTWTSQSVNTHRKQKKKKRDFSLRVFYQSLESLYNHHQMSVKRKVRICFEKEKKIDRLDVVVFFFLDGRCN